MATNYGRLAAMAALGVIVAPSVLEMLALGACQAHMVTVKLIAGAARRGARKSYRMMI